MILKLAWRNVKKSYRDFTLYFMTLMFAICMFYSFHTFKEQQIVFDMTHLESELLTQINVVMSLLSVLVMIVLVFLILYATVFLIQRRKKELAIYMIEGMETRNISWLLMLETFFIGLGSLVTGLLLGLVCSQLLAFMTGHLFDIPLEHYSFIISPSSIVWTISCFCIIFIIVILCSILLLHRYKLIDLLKAQSKQLPLRKHSLPQSLFILCISICFLAYAYQKVLSIPLYFMKASDLSLIVAAGIIGTILLFYSFSGFLLIIIRSRKHLYYQNLNMFSLHLLYNHMRKNFISISMVCLMLLLGIGALATGFSLRNDINERIHIQSPYDVTITSGNSELTALECIDQIYGSSSLFAKDALPLDIVITDEVETSVLSDLFEDEEDAKKFNLMVSANIPMVKQSQVIALLRLQGIQVSFHPNQISIMTDHKATYEELSKSLEHQSLSIPIQQKTLELQQILYYGIRNTSANRSIYAVVPDQILEPYLDAFYRKQKTTSYINVISSLQVNFKQGADTTMFDRDLDKYIEQVNAQLPDDYPYATFNVMTREMVRLNSLSLTAVFTYAGIYLGFIFLVSAGVLLGIQQLNAQSESIHEYEILSKIGSSKQMIHHTILLQISLYFLVPLMLALLHSFIGIQVVNSATEYIRDIDIMRSSMIVGSLLVLIYGGYYIITYLGCKRTIS